MRHCLCCGGQQSLRRAARRHARRFDFRLDKSSVSSARIRLDCIASETYVCPGIESSAGRAGKLVARETDELRAALGNVLDHAPGEVGKGDTEDFQLGQRRQKGDVRVGQPGITHVKVT